MRYTYLLAIMMASGVALFYPAFGVLGASMGVMTLVVAAVCMVGIMHGAFSPICFITAASSLYLLSPAIGYVADSADPLIDPSIYFTMAVPLGLLYTAALLIAYELFKRTQPLVVPPARDLPSQGHMHLLMVLALIGSGVYFVSVYADVGKLLGDITRGDQMLGLTTRTQVLIYFAVAGPMYGFGVCIDARRRGKPYSRLTVFCFFSAFALFAYVSLVMLGDRRILLSEMIACLSILALRRKTVTTILLSTIPAFLVLSLYSIFRAVPFYQWPGVWERMDVFAAVDPSQGEFGGWGRIAQDVLSRPYDAVSKLTFLDAPLSVVPKFLLPDRPVAPSVWYVNTFDPFTASHGGAWGFSIIVESYMNFWVLGPVLLGIFFGSLTAKYEVGTLRRLVLVFVLTFAFRSDAVSLIQMAGCLVAFMAIFEIARIRVPH